MKRKVAIIDPIGAHGSSHHFYLYGHAQGLRKNDVIVSLYTNKETINPKIEGVSFFTFYNNVFKSKSIVINGLKWIYGSIISIIHARKNGSKIFHFHIFYTNVLVLFNLLFVKLLFGKIVLTIHDVNSFARVNDLSIISNIIYRITDLVLTHNEFSKSEIEKIHPYLSTSVRIVPHGNYIPFINMNCSKELSRRYLEIASDKKVLLFFGMIKDVKGLDVLLEALVDVIKVNPDVLLLIAGKIWENNFTRYQKIIDKNNLSKYCMLHTNFISHKDVDSYYAAADLIVLPYKRIYQSGVLMMALSYAKPALVSDLPSLKEIVCDNQTAFLFKSEDSISLSKKLNFILSDSNKLEQVRLNGAKLINTKYDWQKIGGQIKEAYSTL